MPALAPLLGALAAWALVVAIAVGAGAGLVWSWDRHGARVKLPPRVHAVVVRLLGPGAPSAAGTPEPAEPPSPELTMPATFEADESPPEPSEVTADPEVEAPPEEGPLRVVVPVAQPARALDRAAAVEELAALFEVQYETAVALVDAGLWGTENLDEWTRATRGRDPPKGVDAESLGRVCQSSAADLAPKVEAFRKRRAALRDLEVLWGVGPQEAEALYDAGFDSVDALRRATTDKIAKVQGIGGARAFQIRAAAHGLAPAA